MTKNQRGLPDVGKINGSTITAQHFNALVEEMENNYKRQQGVEQIPSDVEYELRNQVWQNIVDEAILGKQYEALGLAVSPAEVSDMYSGLFIHSYVRQLFTDPKTGQYNVQAVKNYIDNFEQLDTNARLQWVELEKYVKKDRQQQKYTALIAKSFFTPKPLAAQLASYAASRANVRVAGLPFSSVSDEDAKPTDADFQKYYDEHKAEFRLNDEIRALSFVAYPLTPTPEDVQKIAQGVTETYDEFLQTPIEEIPFFVSEVSAHSYDSTFKKANELPAPLDTLVPSVGANQFIAPQMAGNQWVMARVMKVEQRPDSLRASCIYILNQRAGGNISRSDAQAKALADSVQTLLAANKMSFEEAVAQFSDDNQKNDTKGDMSWQPDGGFGFLNEDIVNNPVGSVFVRKHPSEVGYLLVKVTDKTPAVTKYRVAVVSREIVPSEATLHNIYNEANHFAGQNRTYQELVAAAQAANLQVREAMVDAMSNNLSGLRDARSIVQWAFDDKTKVGQVADQVFEANDMYIVAAVKDVYKKGYPSLDQIRSMIEPQVIIDKKAQVLLARANEAMSASKDFSSVASKLNASVDTIDSVSYNDYYLGRLGMEPRLQGAIAVSAPNKLVGPIKGAQGVFLFQVDAVSKQTPAAPESLQPALDQAYLQKVRMVEQVLKEKSTIVDQRNKFF